MRSFPPFLSTRRLAPPLHGGVVAAGRTVRGEAGDAVVLGDEGGAARRGGEEAAPLIGAPLERERVEEGIGDEPPIGPQPRVDVDPGDGPGVVGGGDPNHPGERTRS